MTDFDHDVREKKIIARGASHRKRGSKSKKCTLPSDLLTPTQKRKLNGPCLSVRTDRPISWQEFQALPTDLKQAYLEALMHSLGPNQSELAVIFGCSPATVSKGLTALGLRLTDKTGRRRTRGERKAELTAFCAAESETDPPEAEVPESKTPPVCTEQTQETETPTAEEAGIRQAVFRYDRIPSGEDLTLLAPLLGRPGARMSVVITVDL